MTCKHEPINNNRMIDNNKYIAVIYIIYVR